MPDQESKTTPHKPESPNFLLNAEQILTLLPIQMGARDWHAIVQTVAEQLRTHFVLGMQEAKERIKHDPALAN